MDQIKIILTTPRLLLRKFLISDAEHFYKLSLDPDVLTFTGDPPFESVENAAEFLKDYYQYKRYGYGRWAVILKETGEFLGWAGLRHSDLMAQTDLGFRFFKQHWNNGYATEAGKACIEYAFNTLKLPNLVGRVMKGNKASIRVLEKCGMTFVTEMEFELHDGYLYEIVNKY
jgi:RimJ/RimL family protein N-acetyltransferase